ncbi:hypothetical protein ACERK3_08080 [Phycisphaerales bacterium AB-hyl4]|uniref:3-keto-disaccharide hydrolase domain-containing protein n=1 Tax=Natronomicrosphaera hydrolytica TaxID=3242702 RepID=A0ABV4U4J7_9BACT
MTAYAAGQSMTVLDCLIPGIHVLKGLEMNGAMTCSMWKSVACAAVVAAGLSASAAQAEILVQDDFNRTSNTVGTTSDGNATWVEREDRDDKITVTGERLRIEYGPGKTENNAGVALEDFTLDDGIFSLDIKDIGSPERSLTRRQGISYRAATLDDAMNFRGLKAFRVNVKSQWQDGLHDVILRYGPDVLMTADVSDVNPDTVSLRVEFTGNRHKVYIDDELVIDYIDPEDRNEAGYVGIYTSYAHMEVDNFEIRQADSEE